MFVPGNSALEWLPPLPPLPPAAPPTAAATSADGSEAPAGGEPDESFIHAAPDGATVHFSVKMVGGQPRLTSHTTPSDSEVPPRILILLLLLLHCYYDYY